MPENWGVDAANDEYVRTANEANFVDSNSVVCPATWADIFMGANEPDIIGSCMGNMMGKCVGPCLAGESCPEAHLVGSPAEPNSEGHCNCWEDSHATGVGFWPVTNVSGYQPLPTCWENSQCIDSIMGNWRKTAATVVAKGYKYLTAPLVAVSMDWMSSFVKE